MNIIIKERCQKILRCLSERTQKSIRAIAGVTGIPKSSVHRHLQTIGRRQQHPEAYLWETAEGDAWLKRLVFGVIYCFGIKRGIGSESLSEFFHLLQLENRIGCSASALREMEVKVKAQIIAYGQRQSEACRGEAPIRICVGADETFYGLPILVAVELASGFIFSEAECENRTYTTWWEQVRGWFNREQWDCRFMVSDGAKALVKLAVNGLGCPSIPDVFHLLYALSKSIGSTLVRQQVRLEKQQQVLQAKLRTASSPDIITDVNAQITTLQTQQQTLARDHQVYQQSLHGLSQALHPFHLHTGES